MEEIKKELKQEELDQASGGSFVYPEAAVRRAGVDLLKEDGTPGEFGYIWNSGDYYYKGQKLHGFEIDALIQYTNRFGEHAPSLKEALNYFHRVGRYSEEK